MLKDIFCKELETVLYNKGFMRDINELRLRKNKPIIAIVKGQAYYLTSLGLSSYKNDALVASSEMIEDVVFRASNCSIYSINEQLKQGFIMAEDGVRIGIVGDFISENNHIKTVSNYSSLNIRFPHMIKNASLFAFKDIFNDGNINNTLIVSPPSAGKTTFIRDFVYQLSQKNYCYNVLVVDERGEISGGENSKIDLGDFCDVISFCKKKEAFIYGIRSMNPQIIITDELGGDEDINALEYVFNCGVKVIATIHAGNLEELKNKPFLSKIIENKYFKRFVVLSLNDGPGTCEGIYNEKLQRITQW